MTPRINIDQRQLTGFCERWRVSEFSLFGSVLREDFGPDSDVDVMVSFQPDAHWSLLDLVEMKEELERIFGRRVDILTRRAVESSKNWLRKQSILNQRESVYVQRSVI